MDDTNFYKTKTFIALRKKWNEKLKRSGFEDIEVERPTVLGKGKMNVSIVESLKMHHNHLFQNYSDDFIRERREYFRRAGRFNEHYKFKDRRDKFIWNLHAQGLSLREIKKAIKRTKLKHQNLNYIMMTVRRLRVEMGKWVKEHDDDET